MHLIAINLIFPHTFLPFHMDNDWIIYLYIVISTYEIIIIIRYRMGREMRQLRKTNDRRKGMSESKRDGRMGGGGKMGR